MSGYTRQSSSDLVPTAVVRSSPLNAEYNKIRDAFTFDNTGVTGHKHDGSSDEGSYVPLIADLDALNKVAINTANNRVGFFVEVSSAAVEQVRLSDGLFVPVTTNDIDLGSTGAKFKDLHLAGDANVAGDVNVTGALVGAVTGAVTGNVTGDLTGNVTAGSGSSSFTNVTINGTLDVTNTPITNVSDPTSAQEAATKNYVDTADALKLNLSGGTLSGELAMGTSKITGLGNPTLAQDAATKTYTDTADALKLNLTGGTMSGAIAMGTSKITGLGDPTLAQDAATKAYVDSEISSVIDAAPGTLDTLNELAAALGDDASFSTTVTNSIATKLPLAGGTMSGAIAMGTSKITGLGDPTLTQDATTKTYVDTADNLKLNLSGGTMSGAIAMGTSKITGLGNPTLSQDATTKTYVDTADNLKLNLSGGTMSGAIAMGNSQITGLATPTTGTDATTKTYVDGILGSATAAADSAAAALVSEGNAATSETNAAATYDAFDDRYLGSKASDPTVDNDGDALLTGALYWNTTSDSLKIYTGAAWSTAAFDTSGALVAANNLSELVDPNAALTNLGFTSTITELNYTDGVTSSIQTQLDAKAPTSTTVTLAGAQTLTNKTFNLTSNTLLGTTAQFNTALSDGSFTTLAGTETLTNKTLTSPTLTGTPTAPTAAEGTNTTQIATTAFVLANSGGLTTATTTGAAQTVDFANSYQVVEADSVVTTLTFSSTDAVQEVDLLLNLGGKGFSAISGATYDSVTFSVGSQTTEGEAIRFSVNGEKMFMLDDQNRSVKQYSLSTAFDISTASYDSVSFSFSSEATGPTDFAFNTDGTKMYIIGEIKDNVYQYSLSTGFDLSTASYDSVVFAQLDSVPRGLTFNTDGTKMYVLGGGGSSVKQYSLSPGFDLSTASYDSVEYSVSSQVTSEKGLAFNLEGTKMYVICSTNLSVYQYSLSTGFDLSTASYDSVSLSVSGQTTNPRSLCFDAAGGKMYVLDIDETLYQYSLPIIDNSVIFPVATVTSTLTPAFGYNSYKFATVDSGATYYLVSKAEGLGT